MALEMSLDTPSPMVSTGNNDNVTDKPVNESSGNEREASAEAIPDAELEDGEIEDNEEEEQESEEESVDADERKRIKKRIKAKERRKRKQTEKKLQKLQKWAMAMAAGEVDNEEDEEEMEEDYAPEDEQYLGNNEPLLGPAPPGPLGPTEMDNNQDEEQFVDRTHPPSGKKKKRKRKRVPSPEESSEEGYDDLLRKEMNRHQLKRRSSDSSDEGRFEEPGSEGEYTDEDDGHRHRKRKKKKHRHSRHHHSGKKSTPRSKSKSKPRDLDDDYGTPEDLVYMDDDHKGRGYQEEMSEQDYHMAMQEQEGKIHVPKTHLICKFFLENKCKKGLDCLYTHEGSIPKRPEQCKFYLQGYCQKGPLCMFLHHEYPCKYYHTGQVCYAGDKCRFSHDAPTEETQPIVAAMLNESEDGPPPRMQSPRKEQNVPFQKGSKVGGRPPNQSSSIPSLFELDVKPVGAKGQRILEKERQDAMDNDRHRRTSDDDHSSQSEDRPLHASKGGSRGRDGPKKNHHGGPSYQDGPYNGPRGPGSQRFNGPRMEGPRFESQRSFGAESSQPPLLPLPEGLAPVRMQSPSYHEPPNRSNSQESQSENDYPPSQKQPNRKLSPERSTDGVRSPARSHASRDPEERNHAEQSQTKHEVKSRTDVDNTQEAEDDGSRGEAKPGVTDDLMDSAVVIEPPVKMPAQSKALFMRIQQKEARKSQETQLVDEKGERKVNDGADENWYSSDEEDKATKVTSKKESLVGKTDQNKMHTNSHLPDYAAGLENSAVSPEKSNQGPLVSSALMASNKSQNEQDSSNQSQLPGPLASLFSKSQTSTTGNSASMGASNPLPLNLLELVTKGSSSVQKSTNPQVQNFMKGILPANKQQSGYALLECIRDPNLKDPREGREPKSKMGMMFRILKWKESEYSVKDEDDRPTLPPIELHTPTEMKSAPQFPVPPSKANVDPRTQAVVDALKKFIDEARQGGPPADPRTVKPADPRTHPGPPQGMPPPPFLPHGPERMPMGPNIHYEGMDPMGPPGGFHNQPRMPQRMPFPRGQRMQKPPMMQNQPPLLSDPRYPPPMQRPPRPRGPGRGFPPRPRPPRPQMRPPFGSPPNHGESMPMPRLGFPPGPAAHDPRSATRGSAPGPRMGPVGPRMQPPNPRLPQPDPRSNQPDPRPSPLDPRLARRNSNTASSDGDSRPKDPRLARLQGGPTIQGNPQRPVSDSGPPPLGFNSLSNSGPGAGRGRPRDPRQAPANITGEMDHSQIPPSGPLTGTVPQDQSGLQEQSGPLDDISIKDMFKGKDPTASPFL